MLKKMLMVILMTATFTKESLTQEGCTHGNVQLVHGNVLRSQGIVEICINSRWGRVCTDGWGDNDAAVVCRQLGYGSEGANRTFWTGPSSVPIFLDNVNCRSNEETLLNCSHLKRDDSGYYCHYSGFAGVNCSEERLRAQNVSTTTVNSSNHTVMISWELYSGVPHKPSSFRVECYNRRGAIEFSLLVYNETLTHVSVGGIVSSVSFACCVSVVYYYGDYEAERKCTSTDSDIILPLDLFNVPAPNQTSNQPVTTPSSTQMMPASIGSEKVINGDLNTRASIIGGVLGSIIIILLLLLAMCGGALLFLLRSRSMTPKISSAEMAINRNVSYETTELVVNRNVSYETIANSNHPSSRQQPLPSGRNRVSVSLSENYVIEYLEPHLATGGGGEKGEAQHEDYL